MTKAVAFLAASRSHWVSRLPAEGLHVSSDHVLCFAVEGRGRFPHELLVQDHVSVLLDEDQGKLKTRPNQRHIVLVGRGCSPSAWVAQGWSVVGSIHETDCSETEYRRPRNFFGDLLEE